MTTTLRHVTYHFDIAGSDPVEQMMGNGRRRITPLRGEVTVYRDGTYYVRLTGPSILRSGAAGSPREVGWRIGGRWNSSDSAPAIVFDLIEAVQWMQRPRR